MDKTAPMGRHHSVVKLAPEVCCFSLVGIAALCLVPSLGHAAAPKSQVSVTVFYLPQEGVTAKDVARVSRGFSKALQANPRLKVQDSDKLLAEFAGDLPRAAIQRAQALRKEGLDLFRAGQAAEALPRLIDAAHALTAVVPFIHKQDLAHTECAVAVAHAACGNRAQALQSFVHLLTWRPHFRYDTVAFDPSFLPLFIEARGRVKKRRRGSIELITDPEGAKAFVDGHYVGLTPTVAWGMVVGKHIVTYKKTGYIKSGHPVMVSPTQQKRYGTKLRRSEKFLLLKQSLAAAKRKIGAARPSSAMVDLGRVLFVKQLIFASIRRAGPDWLHISAYLYDLRSKLRLSQVQIAVGKDSQAFPTLARTLYSNVSYAGVITAPPDPPPPKRKKPTPLYAKWWLWTAVVAGLAAGTAAVMIPLYVLEKPCPEDRCVAVSN